MSKYLDTLLKIKKNYMGYKNYLLQFEKIEQFVKGEITPQELVQDADYTLRVIIYYVINKIINFEDKDVRYYIELPQDMFFNTLGPHCILAGEVEDVNIKYNQMKTIGPNYMAKTWTAFGDNFFTEIVGDFSQYPNGVMLYNSDWARIISKYPGLVERMYYLTVNDWESREKYKDISIEEVKRKVAEEIQQFTNAPKDGEPNTWWIGKEEAQYLPQKIIDSISFVVPKVYITLEQLLSGQFGTFDEIVRGQDTLENQDVKVTPKK